MEVTDFMAGKSAKRKDGTFLTLRPDIMELEIIPQLMLISKLIMVNASKV